VPTDSELQAILQTPSENLSIEYKGWLDLSQNPGRATLAKAAIAIANEGGGIIVLGMREDVGDGGALRSMPRPAALGRYSQDEVNSAIRRFADPEFHCGLMFVTHPQTGHEHAFVIVPGGMMVPVMSARGCDGVIASQRCYVRKSGPRSEEPFTAEEWRKLLQRCLQAGRESMLNAIRIIVQGHNGSPPTEEAANALAQYCDTARERWQQLVDGLPADDIARMPHGHYDICFELVGVRNAGSATELRHRMEEAGRIRLTGWGPFVSLTRQDLAPQPVGGSIECWLGRHVEERLSRAVAHCDFWRAHPSGLLFLQRGYDEDSLERVQPGTIFDITLPIWRVGEAMLFVARLARQYDDDETNILVRCRYSGLAGRQLDCLTPGRHFSFARVAVDDTAELETQATVGQIEDNLVEILHQLLAPLYERFAFFELPRDIVRAEVEQLRRNRF